MYAVFASGIPALAELWPYLISIIVTGLGLALARIIKMIDNKRDRELIKHVVDKHSALEVDAVAKALARTRWRPWGKPEPEATQEAAIAPKAKTEVDLLERTIRSKDEPGDPEDAGGSAMALP